ncbi:hypothetical protein NESM_000045400 [Novymonas esmeraldas]|uniref:RRM domain-containing protein n=1 Tax=Novymonas esmeraldas TaxID=1808958 RepID=A0AAW0F2Z3_9TRYP
MDPSKRICLKNLPDGCTKREIAELVRNRTGTPIHSIDLGLDSDGQTRRYAHFSCEGAKHVLEVLSTGVVMRDSTIYAHPAKTHYSFRYAEARRKREREEAEAQEQLDAFWAASRQRFLDRTNGGELPKNKAPKDFYASKRKYAKIAAEIALTSRRAHAGVAMGSGAGYMDHPNGAAHAVSSAAVDDCAAGSSDASPAGHQAASSSAAAVSGGPHRAAGGNAAAAAGASKKRAPRAAAAKSTPAPVAAPPPPPPEPTKEERKLSGLQAKLAALKEKLKK